MRHPSPWLLLLLALAAPFGCGGGDDPTCAAGFTVGDDGLCYQAAPAPGDDDDDDTGSPTGHTGTTTTEDPPEVEDVLASLPRCRSDATGDGELDLARGCAAGLCAGDTWEEMVAVAGDPAECSALTIEFDGYRFGQVDCAWSSGVGTTFGDLDFDGLPDAGATAYWVEITAPYGGSTSDGLGLDDEVSCFLRDESPRAVSFDLVDRDWYATYLSFEAFSITDYADNRSGAPLPDGLVDQVTLYGP